MKLLLGDCIDKLKEIEDNSVDSMVTDPPYELGFMGKSWDRTGIANNVEMWKECLRVLKPGGYLLAFGGTRTYHRMASAIEDAGFEVRDMIEWVYASGFPKSLNIGKAVDKLQGNEREDLGEKIRLGDKKAYVKNPSRDASGYQGLAVGNGMGRVTKGNSEWEGWGTALKPAHEPICMARKPLAEKTVAENCLKWGTGGLNIDGSRVEISQEDIDMLEAKSSKEFIGVRPFGNTEIKGSALKPNTQGRFPANLIHDNSEEVRECFPETKHGGSTYNEGTNNNWLGSNKIKYVSTVKDSGNASRFFKSIIYQAKASKSERTAQGTITNAHPTIKPISLMTYLIKMITPKGGIVLDPFMGSGSTGCACVKNGYDFIGIEKEPEYLEIAKARIKASKEDQVKLLNI